MIMSAPTAERTHLLDALRGFALFGVVFSNYTGLGFDRCPHVSAITLESLAVGIFVLQVLWSHWWLGRFRFGPIERLWHSLTYRKVMAMRK